MGACIAIVDHYSSERFFGAAMERALRAEAGDTELPPIYQSVVDYQRYATSERNKETA